MAGLHLLIFSCAKAGSILRHEPVPVVETDPLTHKRDINHHMLLHQTGKRSPVDGVLVSKNTFTTQQMEDVCKAEHVDCIEGVPMVVVRCSKERTNEVLATDLPEVEWVELKTHLPEVVKYLREHIGLSDVDKILLSYSKAGVLLPVDDLKEEFSKEHVELEPRTPLRGTAFLEQEEAEQELDEISEEDEIKDEESLSSETEEDRATLSRYFILHQADASSHVDGVLFMKNGRAFDSGYLKKACSMHTSNLECLDNLPMTVLRAPTDSVKKIFGQLPVTFMSLQQNSAQVVDFLREHIPAQNVAEAMQILANSDVTFPEEISKEFQ